MSFVYAEKYKLDDKSKETVHIFCDTKIIPTDYSFASFSSKELDLIKKYGIIKSTIICPEICVSFAGNNLYYAGKLFQTLNDKHFFDRKYVVDTAYDIHMEAKSKDDIEFIISSYENNKVCIDCIKERELFADCQIAHIGSVDAFTELQKNRNESDYEIPIFQKTQMAFKRVVQECRDNSVGGFDIKTLYDYEEKSFKYANSISYSSSKEQIVQPGESIKFFTSAEDGGYTVEVVSESIFDIIVYIEQMESIIIFTRRYRYDNAASIRNLDGFMLPMLAEKIDNKMYIKGI